MRILLQWQLTTTTTFYYVLLLLLLHPTSKHPAFVRLSWLVFGTRRSHQRDSPLWIVRDV
jgi:hypothetical protein